MGEQDLRYWGRQRVTRRRVLSGAVAGSAALAGRARGAGNPAEPRAGRQLADLDRPGGPRGLRRARGGVPPGHLLPPGRTRGITDRPALPLRRSATGRARRIAYRDRALRLLHLPGVPGPLSPDMTDPPRPGRATSPPIASGARSPTSCSIANVSCASIPRASANGALNPKSENSRNRGAHLSPNGHHIRCRRRQE